MRRICPLTRQLEATYLENALHLQNVYRWNPQHLHCQAVGPIEPLTSTAADVAMNAAHAKAQRATTTGIERDIMMQQSEKL